VVVFSPVLQNQNFIQKPKRQIIIENAPSNLPDGQNSTRIKSRTTPLETRAPNLDEYLASGHRVDCSLTGAQALPHGKRTARQGFSAFKG
jgi:hypothetical protein